MREDEEVAIYKVEAVQFVQTLKEDLSSLCTNPWQLHAQ